MFNTRKIVQAEVKALHKRIGKRLFGTQGQNCLNIRSNEFNSDGDSYRPYGLLGEMGNTIAEMKSTMRVQAETIAALEKKVKALTPKKKPVKKVTKKVAKKSPAKKKVAVKKRK